MCPYPEIVITVKACFSELFLRTESLLSTVVQKPLVLILSLLAPSLLAPPLFAYEINDQLSVNLLLAGSVQCQNVSDAPGFDDTCEAAFPVQPEINYLHTKDDQLFFKFGFAAGNGLTENSPFNIATWAADVKDNEDSINSRNKGNLLTAWYKHTFNFSDQHNLGVTIGIIDGTDYLGLNSYANDEYTQFMNAALTNAPNVFIPSYDIGSAVEWLHGPWSFNGVLMDISENSSGNEYIFYGLQAGYHTNNRFGAGNFRLISTGANSKFPDPENQQLENRNSLLISFDQEFGHTFGGWTRVGWQSQEAAVDYSTIYSGGIDIKGTDWGRTHDNIGLGFAYLDGANTDIDNSRIFEAYYRWQISDSVGLTADIQFLNDRTNTANDPKGTIYSLRAVAVF